MERLQQWWKRKFSFKNATIVVCFINLITVLFLLMGFLSPSNRPISVQERYIKESEELRKAMEPLELMKRVREIQQEVYRESEPVQNKETKQTAAVDLVTRLNNVRSSSDNDNMKALEEWRKRKMERAKQRGLGKNVTTTTQS